MRQWLSKSPSFVEKQEPTGRALPDSRPKPHLDVVAQARPPAAWGSGGGLRPSRAPRRSATTWRAAALDVQNRSWTPSGLLRRPKAARSPDASTIWTRRIGSAQGSFATICTSGHRLRRCVTAWAISSVGEHCLHTAGVAGSNPASPTRQAQVRGSTPDLGGRASPRLGAYCGQTLPDLGGPADQRTSGPRAGL